MSDAREFQSQMQHLDGLLIEAEQDPSPGCKSRTQELVRTLLGLHGEALHRLLEHLEAAGEAGADILKVALRDEVISPILLLHGLHPRDMETRVRGALEKVGPYTASHGGHVELLSVTSDGVVSLRLEGSCHGCPSSRVTLQTTIEQEILAAAPEVISIVVEGLVEQPPAPAIPNGFVPIDHLAINGSLTHAAL
jgi:Fe-S cluster biogenesis protein NfuA